MLFIACGFIPTIANAADAKLSLIKMHIPESLRTENIKKYIQLSEAGSDFVKIVLDNDNKLPDFSTLFTNIGSSKIDGVYNTNNTSGTKIIENDGKMQLGFISDDLKDIYMIAASGGGGGTGGDTPDPTCSTDADCVAGTCNSGTCTCFEHAQKSNNKCACSNGYMLNTNGTACIKKQIPIQDNIIYKCTTGATDEIVVSPNNCVKRKFTLTTAPQTSKFRFNLSAKGSFYVDWGDGTDVETISKSDTTQQTYNHNYDTAGEYTIRFGGLATGYSNEKDIAAIQFYVKDADDLVEYNSDKVAAVSGSLAAIFPQYGTELGEFPQFYFTFAGTENLTSVNSDLFNAQLYDDNLELYGAPGMFKSTFQSCGLTALPENLFASITQAHDLLFSRTFGWCNNLTGYIPKNTFAGLIKQNSPTTTNMWNDIFVWTKLATSCDGFSGMQQFNTGYEDYWNTGSSHYVSCEPAGSSGDNDPILITCTGADDEIVVSGNTCVKSKFEVTTIKPLDHKFEFFMSAKGTFYVDWDDGPVQTISRTDTTETRYYHNYPYPANDEVKTYKIRFGGVATGYSDVKDTAALRFHNTAGDSMNYRPLNVHGVSGSLAKLFPQLHGTDLASTPQFYQTFMSTKRLKEIPEGLFDGLTGGERMFYQTFYASAITNIPDGLFRSITRGAPYMFVSTFNSCDGLTEIPPALFSGIKTGAPYMFASTFNDCNNITSIPENLFNNITSTAQSMFYRVFNGCSSLGGYIPRSTFAGLINANNCTDNEAWTDAFKSTQLATSCDNYPNTTPVTTCYNDYWDNHVSCVPQ